MRRVARARRNEGGAASDLYVWHPFARLPRVFPETDAHGGVVPKPDAASIDLHEDGRLRGEQVMTCRPS